MSRFRKKPIVIEAIQYLGEAAPILDFMHESECFAVSFKPSYDPKLRKLVVGTPDGDRIASYGDWLIRDGTLRPCKPDIFEATYEPAD